jgi:hypothetical protein
MSTVAAPYGLRPVNLLGGQPYNGGAIRQIPMTVNVATPIGFGDVVEIGIASAGQPSARQSTPVAGTTGGILGVCMGVSFIDPVLKQQQFANSLPGGAVTAGYTNIMVLVNDDPNQLYQLQSAGSVARTVQGKFCALGNFTGAVGAYGNSQLNGATPANTATLAMRIVDFASTPGDAFTDLIVKFNFGVLMWQNTIVTAN